jgi:hypothetical protein
MCPRAANSKEHAPPRCIFPSSKDFPNGIDYRVNLVTVPSCDVHNSEKSHDDEYLLFVLAGSYTSSSVGLSQFITKVRRAFERAPSKAKNFVRQSAPVQLKRSEDSEWEDGLQVVVDGARLDSVLSNCARALYFESTGRKFQGPADVMTNFTMYLDASNQQVVSAAFDAAAAALSDAPKRGNNPTVFWYKFMESDSMALFYMCFYDSSPVLVRFKKIILAR